MTPEPVIWVLEHWPAIMAARESLGPTAVAAPFMLLAASIILGLIAPLVDDE